MENMLATLRLIVTSNGKKVLGAILLLLTSIVWLTSSSVAIVNLDLKMVLAFSIGSFVGAYLGSFLEEKIALGNHLLFCISSKKLSTFLRNNGYIVTSLQGEGIENEKEILFIVIKRKKQKEVISLINSFDNKAIIVSNYININ
jgi:uncharacterized protein YebE (UPF0316 family)